MTPEETLDWLAQQHFDQCREERPIQDWIRKMKSQLPVQPAAVVEPHMSETHKQEPTNNWSEWRGMVVQNLMRHGIDKDFARRLAHFYQDKAPQPKEPAVSETHKQEPLEYWNAVEGWVKIDEVREHFDSVGCATIYKTAGEGRVPLSLCKAQPPQPALASEQQPATKEQIREAIVFNLPLYTTPPQPQSEARGLSQSKPLTDEQIYDMYNEPRSDAEMLAFARAIEAAHGIRTTDFKEKKNGSW